MKCENEKRSHCCQGTFPKIERISYYIIIVALITNKNPESSLWNFDENWIKVHIEPWVFTHKTHTYSNISSCCKSEMNFKNLPQWIPNNFGWLLVFKRNSNCHLHCFHWFFCVFWPLENELRWFWSNPQLILLWIGANPQLFCSISCLGFPIFPRFGYKQ